MHTIEPVARRLFIAALRWLADYLEAHPRVPVPVYRETIFLFAKSPQEVGELAELLDVPFMEGLVDYATGEHRRAEAVRDFGAIAYAVQYNSLTGHASDAETVA
jgi:hypothetical protein